MLSFRKYNAFIWKRKNYFRLQQTKSGMNIFQLSRNSPQAPFRTVNMAIWKKLPVELLKQECPERLIKERLYLKIKFTQKSFAPCSTFLQLLPGYQDFSGRVRTVHSMPKSTAQSLVSCLQWYIKISLMIPHHSRSYLSICFWQLVSF